MSMSLRIELLICSLLFLGNTVRLIKKDNLQVRSSLSWLFLSLGLVVCGVFPQIPIYLSRLLGFETTSNFLIIVAIFMLFLLELKKTLIISRHEKKLTKLTQELAILKKESEKEQ